MNIIYIIRGLKMKNCPKYKRGYTYYEKCLVLYESFHHGNTKALIEGIEKNLGLKDENFQKIDIQKMPAKLDFDQYKVIIKNI